MTQVLHKMTKPLNILRLGWKLLIKRFINDVLQYTKQLSVWRNQLYWHGNQYYTCQIIFNKRLIWKQMVVRGEWFKRITVKELIISGESHINIVLKSYHLFFFLMIRLFCVRKNVIKATQILHTNCDTWFVYEFTDIL